MKTIYKYTLDIDDTQVISLPHDATLLSVGEQNGHLQLWAELDPTAAVINRRIRIFGTGHPVDEDIELRFIGTVITMDGRLVWHVFEELLFTELP